MNLCVRAGRRLLLSSRRLTAFVVLLAADYYKLVFAGDYPIRSLAWFTFTDTIILNYVGHFRIPPFVGCLASLALPG